MSEQRANNGNSRRQVLASQEPYTPPPADRGNGETVVVACNLPNGLILQRYAMKAQDIWTPVGPQKIEMATPVAGAVVLYGNAVNMAAMMRGEMPQYPIVNGYAFTSNVPKDFWDEWFALNQQADYVVNQCVMAEPSEHRLRARVNGLGKMVSGLEPLDPDTPAAKSPELRRIRRDTEKPGEAA